MAFKYETNEEVRLKEELAALRAENNLQQELISGMMVENAELRKDAERMDWIQDHARCDPKMDGNHVWWPTSFNNNVKGPTL